MNVSRILAPYLLCLSVSVTVASSLAVQPDRIELTLSCPGCRIELTSLVRLGDAAGSGMVSDQAWIWTNPRGGYFVSASANMAEIRSYDASGKFSRIVGRLGDGPGEYRAGHLLAFTQGDTMHILDRRRRQWTILDRDFSVRDAKSLPLIPVSAVPLSSDLIVLTGELDTRSTIGYPVHLVSRTKGLVRSFGVERPVADPRRPWESTRILGPGSAGRVWIARPTSYEIKSVDTLNRVHRHFLRSVPWFPPRDRPQNGSANEVKPAPGIIDVREDADGLLWVLLSVADSNWAPRAAAKLPNGMEFLSDLDQDQLWDTIVDVIDPRTGSLLASQRFPQYFRRFGGDRVVYSYAEDTAGNPFYSVHRLSLSRR
jgi:hypothetical protein